MNATDAVIDIEAARFAWPGPAPFSIEIARLRLDPGERAALLGPSGGGKSTLLSLITGLATASSGRVRVLGRDLADLSGPARDRVRAEGIGV
ncbi:MAG: ATP-binding cassette domain-containing protein, partial [Pseudomonadota bacterium]